MVSFVSVVPTFKECLQSISKAAKISGNFALQIILTRWPALINQPFIWVAWNLIPPEKHRDTFIS
jgi:hypothetical protein